MAPPVILLSINFTICKFRKLYVTLIGHSKNLPHNRHLAKITAKAILKTGFYIELNFGVEYKMLLLINKHLPSKKAQLARSFFKKVMTEFIVEISFYFFLFFFITFLTR